MKAHFLTYYLSGMVVAPAAIETVFLIGEDDSSHEPFGPETGITEVAPGSASALDDHYYITSGESPANFERALTTWDPRNVVHFDLSSTQANPDGHFTLKVDFIWSGRVEEGAVSNVITVRLNGEDLHVTPPFESYQEFIIEFEATEALVQAGTNSLEIARTGGSPSTWLGFDSISLQVDPTANEDSDADGLPLYWETLYQLSDNDPTDAASSADEDLLTNLQEFQAGTNPRNPDSDDDGLADHLETASNPLDSDSDDDGLLDGEETISSPILADTDGDGSGDAWEIRTGYDPSSSSSTPPAFSGAIGINFRSGFDEERGLWSDRAPNGWIPQTNWNHTSPLREWGVANGEALLTGDTGEIVSPLPGKLVDAAGNEVATTVSFSYDGCWTSANSGKASAELLNGYLRSDETHRVHVTLTGVPFANYDLYAYLAAEYVAPEATLRLNGDSATNRTLRVQATSPTRDFLPEYQTAGPLLPRYNVVRFANLSSPQLVLELLEGDGTNGLAAIQIVDIDADSDGDLLPDYWELQHRTGAGSSNATQDSDGDLLDNAGEFARGTDPNRPDSDNDGLSDFVETNSGTFVDHENTGTNPLFGDSDNDGVSDSEEIANPLPSNPLLADTDGDGLNDALERSHHFDPNDGNSAWIPVPNFDGPDHLNWQVTNVQLVQNHDTPPDTEYNSQHPLLSINVTNALQPGWRTFEFLLTEIEGRVGYYLIARGPGGFRHPDNYDLYFADLVTDQRQALGLSGFGSCDISDPLTFEVHANPNPAPATDWTINYRVINQRTAATVISHSFTNGVVATTIADQTATWRDQESVPDRSSVYTGLGVDAYFTATPLEDLPAFIAHADSDNDGIPDTWELAHGLNPNNPADAISDADSDGLNSREEFYHGTSPNDSDSDDDGANDAEEVHEFSNPTESTSSPPYLSAAPVYDPDLDNNGLPDVWEAAFHATGLQADGDDDNDGYRNAEEASAGTDPLDANSHPFLDLARTESGFRLSWPRVPGKNQTLQSSPNLLNWEPVSGSPSLTGDLSSQEIVALNPSSFFQVQSQDQDSDGDTLNDWTELALGLSPAGANSSQRPAPLDLDGDGAADSSTAGDLIYWHNTFANSLELKGGGSVSAPTPFDASRLLLQATFGPTMNDIQDVRRLGLEGWIDDQIQNQPATHLGDYIKDIQEDFDGSRTDLTYSYNELDDFLNGSNVDTAFARAAISGPDQLRQRVAFALSQIIVISRRDADLANALVGVTDFYDLLIDQAFGNYEELLMAVTLHPTMGRYLSHVGNQPPAPELNRYPDENYARELMQLFTIGIWELEQDGTRKLDSSGNPIPTYSNEEITNFARVMTGLWFGGNPWGSGGWQGPDYAVPMSMHPDYHDFEAKTLLDGFTIPKRPPSVTNGLLDLEDAVGNLFRHANCAPFVSKALIQFLVTSNPSPAYVQRISTIFDNDGQGERGNLGAVVKAILMDPEARDPAIANTPEFGIFREPVIRTIHLARLTDVNQKGDLVWWDYGNYYESSFQQALSSPSVFNFFRPDYRAPGVLTENGLVSPALEITNSYSAVSFPNKLWEYADQGISLYQDYSFPPDYSRLRPYAHDHEALLDYLNLVVCGGHLTAQTRSIIKEALDNTDPTDDAARMRLALYLALMSPQGAVQR
ncbi:DUF1800 family protein [Roseibacillus persicicus]|uniref:DUF1800 family protein n=1 Tax=Roseibacillus persicicus TaxID=454148 RepID=UPI00280D45C2|nr:DUF1800 family protein [Roseibacillus persicicus]MDQ8189950.1 DUF1800 family protein [Roseibacillus persicicus]